MNILNVNIETKLIFNQNSSHAIFSVWLSVLKFFIKVKMHELSKIFLEKRTREGELALLDENMQ